MAGTFLITGSVLPPIWQKAQVLLQYQRLAMLEGVDIISYPAQGILTTPTHAVSSDNKCKRNSCHRLCNNVCLKSNDFIVERNVL